MRGLQDLTEFVFVPQQDFFLTVPRYAIVCYKTPSAINMNVFFFFNKCPVVNSVVQYIFELAICLKVVLV